jgi:arylsulfatase A
MKRRDFIKAAGYGAATMALSGCVDAMRRVTSEAGGRKPNIVFILADDLGYAELGCYGQKKIRTPNIDKLALQGMKFTQHYSGNPVCAPSRCALMTGMHTGHAQIRANKEVGGAEGWKLGSTTGGQWPLKAGTITVAKILKDAGYTTGAFGKWGLGRVGTTGDPQLQGFDHFFGYICQRQAHTYYPNHLWRDGQVQWIEANKDGKEQVYSHDLIANEALEFIRRKASPGGKANKDRPFFLYVPFTIPHVALQVPADSLAEYEGKWPDPPYNGDKGYFPHPHPRACYAAMVTRMDRDVGRIMSLLKELNLEDNTLVIFTSDNGPTFNGGSDSAFFQSAGPLRGLKASVYEGGIRVPFIARWPGRIKAGSTSDHVSAFWDFLPTCCELIGEDSPANIDGISMLPTLFGLRHKQKKHDYLYWELSGQQAVRIGPWKAVRLKPDQKIQLYNLDKDLGEQNDVAGQNPEIVAKIEQIFTTGRTESDVFRLPKGKSPPA